MIHHLSYPRGDSVNDFIDPELCTVQYTSFDQAIKMVQTLGKGCYLSKCDIKNAFACCQSLFVISNCSGLSSMINTTMIVPCRLDAR